MGKAAKPAKPKKERRTAPRVPWQIPAKVSSRASDRKQVELRDISSRGLFFFTQAKVEADSKVEIVLMMPPGLQQSGEWVCCQATVVRVEEDKAQQKIGVAAVIDRCEALPQI